MELNELIKLFRETNDYTMQEFADRCGLSKGYISMLEKGVQPRNGNKITPSIETIAKLAKAMGMTPDELIQQLNGDQEVSLTPIIDEKTALLQKIYDENKILFDAADNATPEQIRQAAEYLEFLKSQRG